MVLHHTDQLGEDGRAGRLGRRQRAELVLSASHSAARTGAIVPLKWRAQILKVTEVQLQGIDKYTLLVCATGRPTRPGPAEGALQWLPGATWWSSRLHRKDDTELLASLPWVCVHR